jgi:hypothetical protein
MKLTDQQRKQIRKEANLIWKAIFILAIGLILILR